MIEATETTSGTTCVIRAQDFSHRTTDDDRDRWTAGKMRHVLAAIGNTPVIITTDRQTGHTVVNVRLGGLRTGWAGCGYEVAIVDTYEGCPEGGRTVWHRLDSIGDTIIPLSADGAKWKATRSYGDEASHAVELAQAQHGKASGREWGSWTAVPTYSGVSVTYRPYPSTYADVAPRGQRGHWTYSVAECRAQGCIRQQRMHEHSPSLYDAPAKQSDACDNRWHRGLFDYMPCAECSTD